MCCRHRPRRRSSAKSTTFASTSCQHRSREFSRVKGPPRWAFMVFARRGPARFNAGQLKGPQHTHCCALPSMGCSPRNAGTFAPCRSPLPWKASASQLSARSFASNPGRCKQIAAPTLACSKDYYCSGGARARRTWRLPKPAPTAIRPLLQARPACSAHTWSEASEHRSGRACEPRLSAPRPQPARVSLRCGAAAPAHDAAVRHLAAVASNRVWRNCGCRRQRHAWW